MKHVIDLIRQTRSSMLEGLNGFSVEQLNKMPAGFNNNIIWNLGHVVAVQ